MVKMDDAFKMQEKVFEDLCEDIVNISRVLPNLTPLDLQTELLELRNDPERVTTILKKHFKFYNEERENQMSQDIKMIKRVLPNTPIVQISKDLADVGQKKNRVQLVLKKYFTTPEVNSCKRSSNDSDLFCNKILKLDESVTSDHLLPPNSPIDKLDIEQFNINEPSTSKLIMENNNSQENISYITETPAIITTTATTSTTTPTTPTPPPTTTTRIEEEEITSQDSSGFNNSLANEIVHSISKILSPDLNEEKSLTASVVNDNSDEKNTLYQIINSFYPDLTLDEMELILSDLGINIYECVSDATLNIVLNVIINYFENKPVVTKNDNKNILVKTDTHSAESSSTEEYDFKDDFTQFFQIPTEDSTSVLVKQEIDLPNYTDKNLGLLNKICREIEDDSKKILQNEVFVGQSETNREDNKLFMNIASGTDNWVKSALVQRKDNPNSNANANANVTSTSELNVIKPVVKVENARKRPVCSTVTSASINTAEPLVNPFENHLDLDKQAKRENVVNYINYGLDVSLHRSQESEGPSKRRKADNLNWTSHEMIKKPVRSIERPPRDNLKSSLSNHFGAYPYTSSTTATTNAIAAASVTYSKNFVQYLQNRNNNISNSNAYTEDLNIDGLYLGNELNFENPYNPYLVNNQALPNVKPNLNLNLNLNPNPNPNSNNNNNLAEDKLDMSRRSNNLLTKKEEKEVKALLCELGDGKCNTCKKCLKNTIALKVRNDLFRRNSKTSESLNTIIDSDVDVDVDPDPDPDLDPDPDSDDVVLLDYVKNQSSISKTTTATTTTSTKIPIVVDISESSSSNSNSNPLPGTSTELQPNENHPFYYKIMEMFPDICPEFLRYLCVGKDQSPKTLDYLISVLLEGDYDRRRERQASPAPPLEFDEQYKTLLDLFPDADPTYLQHHCERLFEYPNEFKEFVASLLEHKNYPSKDDYLKKMKLSAQQKQYTTEFDVKKFLEVIPEPEEFFKNRSVKRNFVDQDYALTFLKNQYCHLTIKDINMVFRDCDHSVVKASVILDKKKKSMKSKRRLYPLTNCLNIPLLQEIAYVKNKNEILNYMKMKEQEKIENREFAKNSGLLKICECCYDDEVMPEEMACCENGHIFCKECVKKGCEVKIGEGKLDFPCLTTCEAQFSLQVLQSVLTPKVFSKMAQRKQLEEVKSAGIEDLEFCPFCDFATIPAPADKLFRCLNIDCMKESCRKCKEPSHIPLRCDEVEKENDVKLRTYIEDKMTEALVRKCYKCAMKFIKEDGCNKMTCSCGAMMCYVCNQPVKDYKHFNGQGGDQFHLCPLYSDTHKLHMDAVKLSAENAKKELGIANNQLKIDPTANLDQHYKSLANRNPQNLPPGMEQLNPQHIHIRIQEFHLARR